MRRRAPKESNLHVLVQLHWRPPVKELTDDIVCDTGGEGDNSNRCVEQFQFGQNSAKNRERLEWSLLTCSDKKKQL